MRSDDIKSLYFFKEFKNFYKNIGIKRVSFNPVYKYASNENLDEEDLENSCVMKKYCAKENPQLKISFPIFIIIENIRQKCLFSKYKNSENDFFDKYWEYMVLFGEECASPDKPNFQPDCSKEVKIKKIKYYN
jgi:hypothetical protein